MCVSLEEFSLLLNCSCQGQFVVDVLLPTTLHNHVTFFEGDDLISYYVNDRLFCSSIHQVRFREDPCEVTQRESRPRKLKMGEVQ